MPRGANSKLTKELQAEITQAIRQGGYTYHAIEAAGISQATYQKWMARGAKYEETGGPKEDRRYFDFAVAVRKAQARDTLRSQSVVTRAELAGDWKAAAWSLEKKNPMTYGQRGQGGGGIATVTLRGPGAAADGSGDTHAKVEFYLPDNGRRPDATTTTTTNGKGHEP
jgi:transposase-like protein